MFKVISLTICFLLIIFPSIAGARPMKLYGLNYKPNSNYNQSYSKPTFQTSQKPKEQKYAELLVNTDTGKVLMQSHASELRHPASLTKMMTLYLTFEQLRLRKLSMNKFMRVSKYAASMPRTNLALRAGSYISVNDAIMGLVVHSANDAAVVLGETIAGTEHNFAQLMTKRARDLGMRNTSFSNASGLHNPNQVTTARDMAVLGMALKKHYPEYYPLFARTQFKYKGRTYISHNNVTKQFNGTDGIKTGYINASGFNLVSSVKRREGNLVGVILGGRTAYTRDQRMKQILTAGLTILSKTAKHNYVSKHTQVATK